MSVHRVVSRYAKSLLELAEEKKVLDKVEEDMKSFVVACENNRELLLVLRNPIIMHDKKVAILKGLFGKRMNDLTLSFFEIVSRKSRENVLFEIAKEFEIQYLLKKGIRKAKLTTAIDLGKQQKDKIVDLLARSIGQNIDIDEYINEDLIGGFVIQVDDQMIDSSIRADLIRMRNKFNDSTYINKL